METRHALASVVRGEKSDRDRIDRRIKGSTSRAGEASKKAPRFGFHVAEHQSGFLGQFSTSDHRRAIMIPRTSTLRRWLGTATKLVFRRRPGRYDVRVLDSFGYLLFEGSSPTKAGAKVLARAF